MFWRPNEIVVLLVMIGNFKSGTRNFKGGIGNSRGSTRNFKDEAWLAIMKMVKVLQPLP